MKKIKLTSLSEQKMKVIKGGSVAATANCDCMSACGGCDAISMRGTGQSVLGTLSAVVIQKPTLQ